MGSSSSQHIRPQQDVLHVMTVPVRTVGEQAYRIKEFKLRFYNSQNMFPPQDRVLDGTAF